MSKDISRSQISDTNQQHRTINGIRFARVQYPAGTERHRSCCPDGQFWLMLRGGWTTRVTTNTSVDCEPFSLSYYLPGEKNQRLVSPLGASLFGIQIPNRLLKENPCLMDLSTPFFQTKGTANRIAMRLLWAFMQENNACDVLAEELLAELMVVTNRTHLPQRTYQEPKWTTRVRDFLQERHTTPLTLQEIASVCDLHPVYLAAAFRQRFGCRIGDYLRRLRLETALHHLCSTDWELATIAREAGFYDQAHFTRHFKAEMGFTPGALRCLTNRF